jgi:hypothetical protein
MEPRTFGSVGRLLNTELGLSLLRQFLYHKHFILGFNIIAGEAYRTIASCSVAQGLKCIEKPFAYANYEKLK